MLEVVCGIIYQNDKIFIARKKKGKSLAGYWEFPGGKIEQNENPKKALIRELKEELGMLVSVENQVGEHLYQYPDKMIKLIAYSCNFIEATFNLTDHDTYEWVTIEELSNYQIAQADLFFVKMITK
ncbi:MULTISPECIES: (deoxy)nucleoside triphosphate pyrophosphohydrolase [unclassified Tenacibaculum]|uniref:(deoxy)nucleoside triphosphate pyrophosphohydrolase n=1 Tax=unclassified Tenacibaculum TaxID=2635139 RepID=UPI001F30EBF0|nr:MULTISPECIES: (deoxy)nucleoside triphosphate pyrophosphohydrolase [unclassified Tenacibaculum]MCF2874308.1 (deoxy)nucleoside triphosphate pyrophosphohydrolase [Tenacibaculum sp. Cn5-1]MCF2934889.1 (deoxy)nucleoside triphosphate pyrophosphohydrolase [Tenacibaculum sp. Cn5-34]MCG7511099.1 (deoxy)nucleoside triphosphate pyrophosphohydrolase [Tenacibaculum sp. Cn5-46]